MDDDYKVIENLGNNEYLKNFKSFNTYKIQIITIYCDLWIVKDFKF
jgi:hypothetical protein